MIHDLSSNQLFLLDGLDAADLDAEKVFLRNAVLAETNLSVDIDKAQQLLEMLLGLQKDVFERISASVGSLRGTQTRTSTSTLISVNPSTNRRTCSAIQPATSASSSGLSTAKYRLTTKNSSRPSGEKAGSLQ